jgi:hypothetical protein
MKNIDTTFVIQGPYSEIHLTMIDTLKEYGRIILSCYRNDYHKIQSHVHVYDHIVLNELVPNPEELGIYNHQNVYRQSYSTLGGLKHVETPYVVIFRTDTYFSNIPYILDVIKNNTQKLCIAPFTSEAYTMLSFGLQVISGTTKNVRNTFETAYHYCKTIDFNNPSTYMYDAMDVRSGAENFFSISNLKYKKLTLGEYNGPCYWMESFKRPGLRCYVQLGHDYEKVVLDNFFLFDTAKLWPYKYKSNNINFDYTEDSCPHRPRSIEDYINKFKLIHNLPI